MCANETLARLRHHQFCACFYARLGDGAAVVLCGVIVDTNDEDCKNQRFWMKMPVDYLCACVCTHENGEKDVCLRRKSYKHVNLFLFRSRLRAHHRMLTYIENILAQKGEITILF